MIPDMAYMFHDGLSNELQRQREEVATLRATLAIAFRWCLDYGTNLEATQARCTSLRNEVRALKETQGDHIAALENLSQLIRDFQASRSENLATIERQAQSIRDLERERDRRNFQASRSENLAAIESIRDLERERDKLAHRVRSLEGSRRDNLAKIERQAQSIRDLERERDEAQGIVVAVHEALGSQCTFEQLPRVIGEFREMVGELQEAQNQAGALTVEATRRVCEIEAQLADVKRERDAALARFGSITTPEDVERYGHRLLDEVQTPPNETHAPKGSAMHRAVTIGTLIQRRTQDAVDSACASLLRQMRNPSPIAFGGAIEEARRFGLNVQNERSESAKKITALEAIARAHSHCEQIAEERERKLRELTEQYEVTRERFARYRNGTRAARKELEARLKKAQAGRELFEWLVGLMKGGTP